jgi:LuxR family maltose regulon positive regulatory protein
MSTAYDLLERLFAIGKSRHIPRLCITALGEQMRLSALQGRELSCEALAARLRQVREEGDVQDWGILQGLIGIQLGLAASYHCMVRNQWQQVRDALAPARPFAEQLRRNKDLLQIHLLDCLAAKKLGLDADSMFRECLYLIETLGLKRLLTDTHPELAQWDRSLRSGDGLLERVPASPNQAAAPARPSHVHAEPKQVAPSMLLTPKERDILSLLANNLSNKEIANALDVSVQTVKWHLKNLFVKLNAGSRKHLVDRARILGIILD